MKKILFYFFIISGIASYAQKKFLPGYIIKLNGDTINGYIYKDLPLNNFRVCTFKADQNAQTIKFKPDEISEYRFTDGKYFVSKKISIDTSKKSLVFLQWIIKGNWSFLKKTQSLARL
jgi:hypothetical protein